MTTLSGLVFWVVTPCGFVGRYQGFLGTLVVTCKSACRYNPEDLYQYLHHCK
jgi:hypothetical protein